jgi:hypothetical protein
VRNNAHRALEDAPVMRATETWRRCNYSENTPLAACNVSLDSKPPSIELARVRFVSLALVQFVLRSLGFGFSSSCKPGEVQPSYSLAPKPHVLIYLLSQFAEVATCASLPAELHASVRVLPNQISPARSLWETKRAIVLVLFYTSKLRLAREFFRRGIAPKIIDGLCLIAIPIDIREE